MPPAVQVFPAPDEPFTTPIETAAGDVTLRLREAGFEAFFAGGFARDLLIGRPIHDIDIATSALPGQVMRIFPDCREIGKSFGVIQIAWGDFHFEVATFRRDVGYHDGRHPEAVVFSSAADDAGRRDFTINGMFFDPATRNIHDHVGGRGDVENRLVRAIGEARARFAEDHLRVMRAVRFAAVLEFVIEKGTWEAVRASAPLLSAISMERIRDEFMRTLMEAPRPGAALKLLRDAGILTVILPEIQAMDGVEQPPEFHPEGDVFTHTCLMLDLMKQRSPALIWSILLHDVAKPPTFAMGTDRQGNPRIQFHGHAELGARMAVDIMKRLRCANDDIEAVTVAVRNHMRFSAVPDMKESTLRKWVGSPNFPLELELHRIDCLASHGGLDHYEQIRTFQETLRDEPVLPKPLVGGRDLLAMGMPGGPAMGRALKLIYDAQLDGTFADREEALRWAREHVPFSTDVNEGPLSGRSPDKLK